MLILEEVIMRGESEAKYGQRAIMCLSGLIIIDVILSMCGVTAMWLFTILGFAQIFSFFAIIYFMFGTMSNIFAISRASSMYNGIQAVKHAS